jgi:hypothetical protein
MYPLSSNVQCVLHDTLLALLARQRHFAVRLSSDSLHWGWRTRCARHQAGRLSGRRSRLCARGGNEGGIGDAEGLEGGGRSRCAVVSLLVAVVGGAMARGENIPRRAMADACLVVENMTASVCMWVCVGGEGVESGEWWRDDEVLDVGGAFDDPKSLAWRSNQRVVIG